MSLIIKEKRKEYLDWLIKHGNNKNKIIDIKFQILQEQQEKKEQKNDNEPYVFVSNYRHSNHVANKTYIQYNG